MSADTQKGSSMSLNGRILLARVTYLDKLGAARGKGHCFRGAVCCTLCRERYKAWRNQLRYLVHAQNGAKGLRPWFKREKTVRDRLDTVYAVSSPPPFARAIAQHILCSARLNSMLATWTLFRLSRRTFYAVQ